MTASNKVDSTATATVAVTILDDNDQPPRFTRRQFVFHVDENRRAGSTVGHVTATDSDLSPNNRHSYYVDATGGDDNQATAFFGVEEKTGRVYTRRPLDRERRGQFQLTLTVRDDVVATLRDSSTVVIHVNDDNDESPVFTFPTSSNDTALATADMAVGQRVARVTAIDRDAGDNAALRYYIGAGNEHGLFDIDSVSGWVIANGSLSPYTMETFRLVVYAEDSGTETRSSSATLFVVVSDGTRASMVAAESAGIMARLLQMPMSGTRLVIVISLVLAMCVVVIAICVTVCVCRLQRRHKLDGKTLKGMSTII